MAAVSTVHVGLQVPHSQLLHILKAHGQCIWYGVQTDAPSLGRCRTQDSFHCLTQNCRFVALMFPGHFRYPYLRPGSWWQLQQHFTVSAPAAAAQTSRRCSGSCQQQYRRVRQQRCRCWWVSHLWAGYRRHSCTAAVVGASGACTAALGGAVQGTRAAAASGFCK